MILGNEGFNYQLVKDKLVGFHANCIFFIADNKACFLEKIEWCKPDLVISAYTLNDFTGLDVLEYFNAHLPYVPIVFLMCRQEYNVKVSKPAVIAKLTDTIVFTDELSSLNIHLQRIINEKAPEIARGRQEAYREQQFQLKLFKAMWILREAQDFPEKEAVVSLLKNIDAELKGSFRNMYL